VRLDSPVIMMYYVRDCAVQFVTRWPICDRCSSSGNGKEVLIKNEPREMEHKSRPLSTVSPHVADEER